MSQHCNLCLLSIHLIGRSHNEEENYLLQYACEEITWDYDREKNEITFTLHVPEAQEDMSKLLDSASQLDLSFAVAQTDQNYYIAFILKSGNGEVSILVRRNEWVRFLEEPDHMIIDYGTRFEMEFLPLAFFKFIDELIDRVNNGEDSPYLQEIIAVFAEEESENGSDN